jgi:hypothetical protein
VAPFVLFLVSTATTMTFLVTATAVTLASAETRDGCRLGWFFNGQACAEMEDDDELPRRNYYYEPPKYHAPIGYIVGRGCADWAPCPPPRFCVQGFALQEGLCKPRNERYRDWLNEE